MNSLYVGLFNGEGEPGGRENWRSNLASGNLTYGSTAVQFLSLPEFADKAANV